jgi:hypothetical protein
LHTRFIVASFLSRTQRFGFHLRSALPFVSLSPPCVRLGRRNTMTGGTSAPRKHTQQRSALVRSWFRNRSQSIHFHICRSEIEIGFRPHPGGSIIIVAHRLPHITHSFGPQGPSSREEFVLGWPLAIPVPRPKSNMIASVFKFPTYKSHALELFSSSFQRPCPRPLSLN